MKIEEFKMTPLLRPPLSDEWPILDIGLHNAAQPYNQNLRAMAYFPGAHGRWMHPGLELYQVRRVLERVGTVWKEIACGCRDEGCSVCGGDGCTSCFKVECPRCCGTGWKDFSKWAQDGYRVDYASGFPIARL